MSVQSCCGWLVLDILGRRAHVFQFGVFGVKPYHNLILHVIGNTLLFVVTFIGTVGK